MRAHTKELNFAFWLTRLRISIHQWPELVLITELVYCEFCCATKKVMDKIFKIYLKICTDRKQVSGLYTAVV